MICWSCQSANPDQAKFCASCGSKMLPEPGVEAACRSCGAPLPLEARFCGYCGTPDPLATSNAEATESVKPSGELARAIAAGPGEATALAYDDDAEEDEALAALEEQPDEPSADLEPPLEDDDEEATIIRTGIEELPLAPPGPTPRPKEPTEPARVATARTLKERLAGEPSPGAYSKKGPSLRARESGKPPPPPPLGRRPAVPQSSSPSMLETKVRPAKPGEGAARGFAKGRPGLAPPPPVAGRTRITPAPKPGASAPTKGGPSAPAPMTRGQTAPSEAAGPTPVTARGGTAPTEAAEPTPATARGGTAPTEAAEPTPMAARGGTAPSEAAEPTPKTTQGGTTPSGAPELTSSIGPARPGPGRLRTPRTVTAPQKAVFSSPRPDTAAILAPPEGWPDITDELAEIRFSAIQGFDEDTRKAISDLRARFPGHPEVDILAEELGEATSSRPSLLEEDADKPTPVEGPPPRGRGVAPSQPEEAAATGPEASAEEPVEEVAETIAMPSLASMGVLATETVVAPSPVAAEAPASETVVAPSPSAPVPPAPLGSSAVEDAAPVAPAPVTSTEAVELAPTESEDVPSEGPGLLVETPMEGPPPAVTGRTLPPSTAEPAVTGRTLPPSTDAPAVTGRTVLPTTAPDEAAPPELLVEPDEPAPMPALLVEPEEPAPMPALLVEPEEPAPPPELSIELLPPPETSEPEPLGLEASFEPEGIELPDLVAPEPLDLAGPSEPESLAPAPVEPAGPSEAEAYEPEPFEPVALAEPSESFEPEPFEPVELDEPSESFEPEPLEPVELAEPSEPEAFEPEPIEPVASSEPEAFEPEPPDPSDEAEIDGLRLPAELLGRSERGTPEPASPATSDELVELDAEEFESLADDDVDAALDSMEELDPDLADSLETFDGSMLEVEPDDSLESLDDDAVELEDDGLEDGGVEEPDRADRTMMVRGYQPPAPFGGAQPPPLLEPEPEPEPAPTPTPVGRSSTTLASEEGSDERRSTLAPLGEDDPRSPDELETTLPPGAVAMGPSARSTFAPDPDGVPSAVEIEPTPSPVSSTRATIIPQEPDVDLDLGDDDDDSLYRPSGMTAPSREADSAAASGHFSVAELGLDDLPDLEASTTSVPPVDLETVDSGALTSEGTVIARAPMPPSPFGAGRASEPVRPVRLLMLGAKGQVVAERLIEVGTHLDIGRNPGEPWASDRRMELLHARLFPAPGGLIVDDFGAPQGVYTKISDTIAVEDGDEFKVGQARLALQRVVGPGGVWGQLTLVRHDDPSPSTYRLDRNEVLIGREEGDITLPNDTFVSGDHCRFGREGNAVYLEDLGSSNGTYIRVRAGQCVAFGGMLLIGHTQFRVEPA